jgi:transcriptional regulator with PAS, ATPase and Fis domain
LDEARQALAVQRKQAPMGTRQAKHTFASFMGSSPAAVEVKRHARRAAQSSSPVLLLGETGTGKELLAHAIHAASPRATGPLVSVNIAAIPDSLLEAEFFGVAPGAYTGADRKGREGKFKLADGGTLFLDEIGDMPWVLQAKLLRALQEGEIEPLGSNRLVSFDVRIIAATSRDMPALVRAGQFREDLFYRLNVLPIRVPALRERASDIPGLVELLGEELAIKTGVLPPDLSPQALDLLVAQPWRGNVRELRNVLEQIMLRSDTPHISAAVVEQVLRESGVAGVAPVASAPLTSPRPLASAEAGGGLLPLAQQVAELEKVAIGQALAATRGNKAAAALVLGISRAKLYERLASLNLVID